MTTTSTPITVPGFARSDDILEPSGFIGGGQIGYNWQFSSILVFWLEADFQGADEKESTTFTNSFTVSVVSNLSLTGTAVTQYDVKIDWFGTVRGRTGYVFGDGAVMTYVTGGLA